MMMMMYIQDYLYDSIEFDQMDVDEDDEIQLETVAENTEVETLLYPNLLR